MSSLTTDQSAKLKAEIVNDPAGRGYAAADVLTYAEV